MENQIAGPHDIVITVFHDSLAEAPAKELSSQLKKQFKDTGIIK